MIISKKKLKEITDKAYSDGFADGANNADADIICSIKWSVEDVRNAYREHYGHNPTDEEISEIIDKLDVSRLEEVGIEDGWKIIRAAV